MESAATLGDARSKNAETVRRNFIVRWDRRK
jgi:hypothetical protein